MGVVFQWLKTNFGAIFGVTGVDCIYKQIPTNRLPAFAQALVKDGMRNDGWAGGYTVDFIVPYLGQCGYKAADIWKAKNLTYKAFGGKSGANFAHNKWLVAVKMANAGKNQGGGSVNQGVLNLYKDKPTNDKKQDNTLIYVGLAAIVAVLLLR